jgi:hypothetical protein
MNASRTTRKHRWRLVAAIGALVVIVVFVAAVVPYRRQIVSYLTR